jgi:aldehyde dehydrogenase (NAD+)
MEFPYTSDGFYIGGGIVEPTGADWLELRYPATGEVYAKIPRPTKMDADRAVDAARGAFATSDWSERSVADRAAVIRNAAAMIETRLDEIAEMSAYEIGAPLAVTRMMAKMVVGVVDGLASLATSVPVDESRSGFWDFEVQHRPRGVVLDIVPWNGPFSGTMMKSARALLAGCTVVSKPPPTAPFSVLEWARALQTSGLPAGAFNVLPADAEVAEHLVVHRGVDLVVFTGGTSIGRRVAALCGERLKPVVLELGGKSAAVVLEDADLQLATDSVAAGVYFNSGQICSALSRMLVPRNDVEAVVELLRQKASAIVMGDPLAPTTTMGPMATEGHRDRVLGRVQAGRNEGADLVFGGGCPPELSPGWFVEPSLFVTDNQTSLAREEIFGPVVAIIPHEGEAEAISMANDSDYGLGGSVFSADAERAVAVASQLETGSVTINGYTTNMLAPRKPFKGSGVGTVTGIEGFRSFQTTRVVNLRSAQGAWTPSALFEPEHTN